MACRRLLYCLVPKEPRKRHPDTKKQHQTQHLAISNLSNITFTSSALSFLPFIHLYQAPRIALDLSKFKTLRTVATPNRPKFRVLSPQPPSSSVTHTPLFFSSLRGLPDKPAPTYSLKTKLFTLFSFCPFLLFRFSLEPICLLTRIAFATNLSPRARTSLPPPPALFRTLSFSFSVSSRILHTHTRPSSIPPR